MLSFFRKRVIYNAIIDNNHKALRAEITHSEWEIIDNYLLTKLKQL